MEVLKESESKLGLDLLYDVAHNIAKKEKYGGRWLLVHRKGATRALPAKHEDNPPATRIQAIRLSFPGAWVLAPTSL